MPKNTGKPASAPADSSSIKLNKTRSYFQTNFQIQSCAPNCWDYAFWIRTPTSTVDFASGEAIDSASGSSVAKCSSRAIVFGTLVLQLHNASSLRIAELAIPAHKFDARKPTMPNYVIFNSCAPEEMTQPEPMDPNTVHSFYWLVHPFVSDLVPFVRRAAHVEANSPEVIMELFARALPIFKHYFPKRFTTPKSWLFGCFLHALCRLADQLSDTLASRPGVLKFDPTLAPSVRQYLDPNRFAGSTPPPPINFDLPGLSCRRTDVNRVIHCETYPYTPEERVDIAPFCVRPFVTIFCLLRSPERITENNAACLYPPFIEAMDFMRKWFLANEDDDLPTIQARLMVSIHQCLDRFGKFFDMSRWRRIIPDFNVKPLSIGTYALSRTVYPPWPFGTEEASNVHPLWPGEPVDRDPNFYDFLRECQSRLRELEQSQSAIAQPLHTPFPGRPPVVPSTAGPSKADPPPSRATSQVQQSPARQKNAPRRFNRMGRNAGSEAPVSAPVSRGPPTPDHVQNQPSDQRPSSPPPIETLSQPPSDDDEDVDMLRDGLHESSEDVPLELPIGDGGNAVVPEKPKSPPSPKRPLLAFEVVVPRVADVYGDRMQKQSAAPSKVPSAPASVASEPAPAKTPTPGPLPSPQSASHSSSSTRSSVLPPAKSPPPAPRTLRSRPAAPPPVKPRSAKHTKVSRAAAKRAASRNDDESDDEGAQPSRPKKKVKLSTERPKFPTRERKRRGESSNKPPAQTALEAPPLVYKDLVGATARMERATTSSTLLHCFSCIAFNKNCQANAVGEKCASCTYAMCSHSLTTDQLHQRIQGFSEHTVFSNSNLVHAMQAVRNATHKLESLQFLVCQREQELLSASNYLSLVIRAMYRYYGRDNMAHLWSVPGALQEIFSNFVLSVSQDVLDSYEMSEEVRAEVLNRWGYVDDPFTENDDEQIKRSLIQFQNFAPEPDDELYVGPFCRKRLEEPEDEEMEDADGDAESSHHSTPVASTSKGKAKPARALNAALTVASRVSPVFFDGWGFHCYECIALGRSGCTYVIKERLLECMSLVDAQVTHSRTPDAAHQLELRTAARAPVEYWFSGALGSSRVEPQLAAYRGMIDTIDSSPTVQAILFLATLWDTDTRVLDLIRTRLRALRTA
ncbi:hypothetical protein C8R46DRAFT_1227918 [Mycena filopes]|nr:hypothetical protein C8R46DRAFT_1227918 [Mycena filopes]